MTSAETGSQRSWSTLRRFAAVGVVGYAVDALVLTLLMRHAGWSAWQARVPSFLIAVTVTWLLNRQWAFAGRTMQRTSLEAMLYGAIQVGGAVTSFAVFLLCLHYYPDFESVPAVPLAMGSGVALGFTFLLSNGLLYARRPLPHT